MKLFLLLLLLPTISASDCLKPLAAPASRVKTLVFGESISDCVLVDDNIQPDFGLFVFDVGSNVVNALNLIEECNPIWGSVIIGTMFLPITILLALAFVRNFRNNKSSLCKRLLMILLLPLYGPVAIAIATPAYIIYVVYNFARRVFQPSYVSNHINDWALTYRIGRGN